MFGFSLVRNRRIDALVQSREDLRRQSEESRAQHAVIKQELRRALGELDDARALADRRRAALEGLEASRAEAVRALEDTYGEVIELRAELLQALRQRDAARAEAGRLEASAAARFHDLFASTY
jgi:chromosome segregation ATPase